MRNKTSPLGEQQCVVVAVFVLTLASVVALALAGFHSRVISVAPILVLIGVAAISRLFSPRPALRLNTRSRDGQMVLLAGALAISAGLFASIFAR